jgi:hypothetical protein
MVDYDISGAGVHAVTTGTEVVFVDIDVFPAGISNGRAAPTNYYGVGLIRFGFHGSWFHTQPLEAAHSAFEVPAHCDTIGWSIFDPGTAHLTEWPTSGGGGTGTLIDNFTDPDGTLLSAHVADTGSTWSNPAFGDLHIVGNQLAHDAFGNCMNINDLSMPIADYGVEATVVVVSSGDSAQVWLEGRCATGGDDGYYLCFDANAGLLRIGYITGYNWIDFDTTAIPGWPFTGSVQLRLDMTGSALSGKVAGIEYLSATDSTWTAPGHVGLRMANGSGTGIVLDNLQAG